MYQNVIKEALTSLTNITGQANSDTLDVTRCQELSYQINVKNVTSISGATVKVQKSLDDTLWDDDTSATNITVSGAYMVPASQPLDGNYYRLHFANLTGHFDVDIRALGKGLV